ncbi:MAG: DUF3817 domain-containing protein [Flavobacteriales bacterium]|nr:MAG: DUF3817 domain-containing protein [Flavobacteriales bacterium]
MSQFTLSRYIPPFKITDAFSAFRVVALVEGTSYLLLLITMILKYQFNMPEPNQVVGMAHGVLFMLYVVLLIPAARQMNWRFGKITFAFFLSLFPFGTFYGEGHVWGDHVKDGHMQKRNFKI